MPFLTSTLPRSPLGTSREAAMPKTSSTHLRRIHPHRRHHGTLRTKRVPERWRPRRLQNSADRHLLPAQGRVTSPDCRTQFPRVKMHTRPKASREGRGDRGRGPGWRSRGAPSLPGPGKRARNIPPGPSAPEAQPRSQMTHISQEPEATPRRKHPSWAVIGPAHTRLPASWVMQSFS